MSASPRPSRPIVARSASPKRSAIAAICWYVWNAASGSCPSSCPIADRDQEVAGLDAVPPGLLDQLGRAAEPRTGLGYLAAEREAHPRPEAGPGSAFEFARRRADGERTHPCLHRDVVAPDEVREIPSSSSPSISSGASRSAAIRSSTAVAHAIESYAARARSRSSSLVMSRSVVIVVRALYASASGSALGFGSGRLGGFGREVDGPNQGAGGALGGGSKGSPPSTRRPSRYTLYVLPGTQV